MRSLKCLIGHKWGVRCSCTRCGAPNHDFAPHGHQHRCTRCGLEQAHQLQPEYRWEAAPPGAWDSNFGPYDDVEVKYDVCHVCGYRGTTGSRTGGIGGGNR